MKNRIDEIISLMTRMGVLEEQIDQSSTDDGDNKLSQDDEISPNDTDSVEPTISFYDNDNKIVGGWISDTQKNNSIDDEYDDEHEEDKKIYVLNPNDAITLPEIMKETLSYLPEPDYITIHHLKAIFPTVKNKIIHCSLPPLSESENIQNSKRQDIRAEFNKLSGMDGSAKKEYKSLTSNYADEPLGEDMQNKEISILYSDFNAKEKYQKIFGDDIIKLCTKYNSFANNVNGRLGMTLELIFGKGPDSDSASDFGRFNDPEVGGVELKTKHNESKSNLIAVTRSGIEPINNCFGEGNNIQEKGENISEIINRRIKDLKIQHTIDNDKNLWLEIIGGNGGKNTTRKALKRLNPKNIKDGDEIIKNSPIATINIYDPTKEILLDELTVHMKGNLFIKGVDNSGRNIIYLLLTVGVKGYGGFMGIPDKIAVQLSQILGKVGTKCPSLMVSFGRENNTKLNGVLAQSYVYDDAHFFKWGNLEGDEMLLALISEGLLTVDIGLRVKTISGGNEIYFNSGISFDVKKLINHVLNLEFEGMDGTPKLFTIYKDENEQSNTTM